MIKSQSVKAINSFGFNVEKFQREFEKNSKTNNPIDKINILKKFSNINLNEIFAEYYNEKVYHYFYHFNKFYIFL